MLRLQSRQLVLMRRSGGSLEGVVLLLHPLHHLLHQPHRLLQIAHRLAAAAAARLTRKTNPQPNHLINVKDTPVCENDTVGTKVRLVLKIHFVTPEQEWCA